MKSYAVIRLENPNDLDTHLTIDLSTGRSERVNADDTVILSKTATAKLARFLRSFRNDGYHTVVEYTFEQEEEVF